jgi:hypothetical protein
MSNGPHSGDRFWKDGNGQSFAYPSDFPTQGAPIDITAVDADFTTNPLRWVYVTGAGVLVLELQGNAPGVSNSFPVAANSVFRGIVRKVIKAGTTATGLTGAR